LLDTDPEEDVRFKSLSAISCLIRDSPSGQEEFLKLNGCSVILRNIQMSKIRLRVKVKPDHGETIVSRMHTNAFFEYSKGFDMCDYCLSIGRSKPVLT